MIQHKKMQKMQLFLRMGKISQKEKKRGVFFAKMVKKGSKMTKKMVKKRQKTSKNGHFLGIFKNR